MGTLKSLFDFALDNPDDFLTSGIGNVQRQYEETKSAYVTITLILSVVCIASLIVKTIFF